MQPESEVNSIQASIMRQLFMHDSRRFAELNVDHVPSDQFSYHLRQLLKYGLIEKTDDGRYRLSVMGRSRAIMLSPHKDSYIEQGFLAVRVVLSKLENGKRLYLMQKRTLVPFKGAYGIPGDKILFGEDVAEAAKRRMFEQTGFDCSVRLCGMSHYREKYLDRIVQDKYFFVFAATYLSGALRGTGSKGNKNLWMSFDDIRDSPKTLPGAADMIEVAGTGRLAMDERTFQWDSY